MNNLVIMKERQAVTTSLQVADGFEKRHSDVIRAIEDKLSSTQNCVQYQSMFANGSYKDASGKQNKMYYMSRDGFTLIAMGFTGVKAQQWKIKYIEAFNAMERELLSGNAKFGSVMDALNEACKLMQDDKDKASVFGSGLSEWKRARKDHMDRVNKLQEDVQLLLNFSK